VSSFIVGDTVFFVVLYMPLYLLSPVFLLSAVVFVLATIDLVLEMDSSEGVLNARGIVDVVSMLVAMIVIFNFE
jgi:hypothetical protein